MHQFSGADQNAMRSTTTGLVNKFAKRKHVREVKADTEFAKTIKDVGKLPVVAMFMKKDCDESKEVRG